jgi:phosphopantothenoylcysteine decarboxylase/phosphopantothenate--cysteine ligase
MSKVLRTMKSFKDKTIVLGVTGSIAAYKAADLTRSLLEAGLKVSVVMTKEAENFITPLTLASLSGEKVYRDLFDDNSVEMPHISLAKDASAVVIAPATANVIGKIANGLADDLLTCIVLATRAPVFIAPAMNVEMYKNKIVQENCEKLKKLGYHFIEPIYGKLACGDVGQGHIASEKEILLSVMKLMK